MDKSFAKTIKKITLAALCLIGISACSGSNGPNSGGGATPSSESQYACYLKIDGIEGNSSDSSHDKWIDVISFSHGSVQSIQSGSPDAAGRGIFQPAVFTHYIDKATPKLQEICMKGSHINFAEMHVLMMVSGKMELIYKYKAEDLKIVKADVSMQTNGTDGGVFIETVQFLANKFTWTQNSIGIEGGVGGNTEACFDQTKKC